MPFVSPPRKLFFDAKQGQYINTPIPLPVGENSPWLLEDDDMKNMERMKKSIYRLPELSPTPRSPIDQKHERKSILKERVYKCDISGSVAQLGRALGS